MTETVKSIAAKAKEASRKIAVFTSKQKNAALKEMSLALKQQSAEILEANRQDMKAAEEKGISKALLDRLMLNEQRIQSISQALLDLVALKDPVGEVVKGWRLPNSLLIRQVRVPLGVIGIIYEARPNVTVDAAGLSLKAGNAVILRGGSLAMNSNIALTKVITEAAIKVGFPVGTIQSLPTVDRQSVNELMNLPDYLDLLVPRGGPQLIATVLENASVPVLWAGAGNCHVYVHKDADLNMAEKIVVNAKVQRPSVCNAAETLLVHSDIASTFVPQVVKALEKHEVKIYGCEVTKSLVPQVNSATEEDWKTEYLDLKMALKVVSSLSEAIDHINFYGTGHSEAIVTENHQAGMRFQQEVDAAAVYVNASTRFTDGGEFGLGAEIGISTQKLHARGPLGLEALTSTKYVVDGNGQVRS
jgi:glutamate-5-semialdehyde dehydrogenase